MQGVLVKVATTRWLEAVDSMPPTTVCPIMNTDHAPSNAETADSATPRDTRPGHRRIRSFALRQGRLTAAQSKALEELWPLYGLEPNRPFDSVEVFGRNAPLIVEIGFGNGESLAKMAVEQPENNFLGIEVHRPGVGHLLLQIRDLGLTNVRIYATDACDVLETLVADGILTRVNLFFPDPWPKKRHHKRRLVNQDFAQLVAHKLKQGGIFHAATDWQDYAEQMLNVLESCPELGNADRGVACSPHLSRRPPTRFESRGRNLGHGVWDLVFTRR